jgi:hypothetical protein
VRVSANRVLVGGGGDRVLAGPSGRMWHVRGGGEGWGWGNLMERNCSDYTHVYRIILKQVLF